MLPSQFWWPCLLTIPNKEKKKKKNNPIPNKDLFLHLKHPPLHTLGYPFGLWGLCCSSNTIPIWIGERVAFPGGRGVSHELSATPSISPPKPFLLSDPSNLSSVPAVYHDLAEVFRKHEALSLTPQRPMTMLQTSSLVRHFPLAACTVCHNPKGKQWKNLSPIHLLQESFSRPPLLLGRFFLCWKEGQDS